MLLCLYRVFNQPSGPIQSTQKLISMAIYAVYLSHIQGCKHPSLNNVLVRRFVLGVRRLFIGFQEE